MDSPASDQSLRVGPGFFIVAFQWFLTFGIGLLMPATMAQGLGMVAGPILGFILLSLWWVRWSGAEKSEKAFGIILPLLVLVATGLAGHPSVVPTVLFVYGIPVVCLAFMIAVALTRSAPVAKRRLAMILAVVVAGGGWALVRSEGVDGYMQAAFAWRFEKTAEERLLESSKDLAALTPPSTFEGAPEDTVPEVPQEKGGDEPTEIEHDTTAVEASGADPAAEPSTAEVDIAEISSALSDEATADSPPVEASPWPGFRGAERDGVIRDLTIATDWQASPPELLWRRPIGPGWGSFVVQKNAAGRDLIFTQEQRGEEEVVAAYRAATGEPVWMHRDSVRFWEALAGAGPRATPELHEGRLYSLGATGLLNVLDAATGAKIWARDVAADSGAPLPDWGFSSSPLIIDALVVIYTGAADGKAIMAYDARSGEPRWSAASGPASYSSVHLATLHGVRQLLTLTNEGITSHAPADGTLLWEHAWPASGARCVQPAFSADGDPLLGTGFGAGIRRVNLELDGEKWSAEEAWTSTGLKPYFNDFVVHKGHAYGFDGRILAAIDVETGDRVWKGGRYGHGQLVLLAEQDLLLVLTDKGDIALVAAQPDGYRELASLDGIEGKTWNHPMVADGVLYIRNGEEMAAFRLPITGVSR